MHSIRQTHSGNGDFFHGVTPDLSKERNMKYKMIVLDLDGTLTNSRKEITPRTKQALMQAQAKGIHVVLASGRPTYGIMPLAEELELKKYGGFILAFNGGKIINCIALLA